MVLAHNKPLIKGVKLVCIGDFMLDNRRKKVFVSSVAALLLLSSIVFLAGARAGPAEDLQVIDVYEPDGAPPPRANVEYEYIVKWRNVGDSDYTAKVRLYEPDSEGDCSLSDMASESDDIVMGSEEVGEVTLTITFANTGIQCFTPSIYYGGSDYEGDGVEANVEPETGDANLYVSFDMENTQFAANEEVTVVFEYGNSGDISTQTPITISAWFGNESNPEMELIAPLPMTFSFVSPDPDDPQLPPERMEFEYTVPDVEEGFYQFKAQIDTKNNNTEDSDTSNNVEILQVCVGDCSQADLRIKDVGLQTLTSEPIEAVAGNIISFTYTIENVGEGEAQGTPSNPLVMFLEVMKCPEGDCSDQGWAKVNESLAVRPGIPGNGGEYNDDSFLRLNWSTAVQDKGFWNVRVVVDGYDSIDESNETNNADFDRSWFRVKSGYFELTEQRPDLIVTNIDEGDGIVYDNEVVTLSVAVSQSEFADIMADNVKMFIQIVDPQGSLGPWMQIDDAKTVGLEGETTFFEYEWTPTKVGSYGIDAYVDRDDEIVEWKEDNNEFEGKVVTVYEKLPDLQISSVDISPVNDEGYAMVGVNSELITTVTNLGVRNMTESEGTKLEVTFYISTPFSSPINFCQDDDGNRMDQFRDEVACELGSDGLSDTAVPSTLEDDGTWGNTFYANQALAIGESTEVSIPFIFFENSAYRFIVKVDEAQEISEGSGGPELNNEAIKNAYAVSSVDAYVTNLTVDIGDGLAGKECPITFDVGVANIPVGGNYRLHFNISVDGTFGWGETLEVSMQNSTGFYPVGTGYSVNGPYGYIDFNTSYNSQTVVFPWIPSKDRTDTYNVSVEVDSSINVDMDNDLAYVNKLDIEKLTTNIVVDAIKVTESDNSATIKVTIGYPQGEQSELDVQVAVHVYRSSDHAAGNPPIDTLTVKSVEGLMRGDSDSISFTWATKDGSYIFVAIVDPDDLIKEVNENDNIVPSKEEKFGDAVVAPLDDDDDDGGLLPSPSVVIVLAIFGSVSLIRRRI